jgi:trk system potassium uptake protein
MRHNGYRPPTRGILIAGVPAPMIALAVHGGLAAAPWPLIFAAAVASLALLGAALSTERSPRWGRVSASVGLAVVAALAAARLTESPAGVLAVVLAALIGGAWLWKARGPEGRVAEVSPPAGEARGACACAVALWLLVSLTGVGNRGPEAVAWLGVSVVVALALLVRWAYASGRRHLPRKGVLAVGALAAAMAFHFSEQPLVGLLHAGVLLSGLGVVVLPRAGGATSDSALTWWEPVLGHPERLLVSTFFGLCLLGTALLGLPASSSFSPGVGLVDAAFTAVSAVCVTGLIVRDTPVDFSPAGQGVILALIQVGGLGIMAFSTAALGLIGRRMSLRHEGVVAGLFSQADRSRLFGATKRLLWFTLAAEAAGSVVLLGRFLAHGDSPATALWRACFTAVSAFCNAGFALQSDSLVGYQQDPWIVHTVGVLIVAGGLSPAVALLIPRLVRGRGHQVSAQTKLVLAATVFLLGLGFLVFAVSEWSVSLAGLAVSERLHNAWFQSVTLRTAGFNSVSLDDLRPSTLIWMMVLMFIGGSPGSTAGGIKTTTAAVLLLSVVAAVRGRWVIEAFGRTIPHRTLYKASAILTAGAASVFFALLAILTTQVMPTRVALFEVVSALGTVGLSLGGTEMLDGIGKGVIIVCMFLGRLGPLTLFMFLSRRTADAAWTRPEEEINVG